MGKMPETAPSDWDLGEWEKHLTIHVGTAYICRQCQNLVMVTRGGVGMMELICCGKPMEKISPKEIKDAEG